MTATLVLVGGGVSGLWTDFVHRGLVLLVLACPCAIVIATPIPSICAIGADTISLVNKLVKEFFELLFTFYSYGC